MLSDRLSLRCAVKRKIVNTPTSEKIPNLYPHRALNQKNTVFVNWYVYINDWLISTPFEHFLQISTSICSWIVELSYHLHFYQVEMFDLSNLHTICIFNCRFWAAPIVLVLSISVLAMWVREKVLNAVSIMVALAGHFMFMVSFWKSGIFFPDSR